MSNGVVAVYLLCISCVIAMYILFLCLPCLFVARTFSVYKWCVPTACLLLSYMQVLCSYVQLLYNLFVFSMYTS